MKTVKMKSGKSGSVVNFGVALVLLAGMFALYSCEKVTIDVPVDSIVVELKDIQVVEGPVAKSGMARLSADDELNEFLETREVKLSDLSLENEVTKYQSRITDATVGTASITITSAGGGGTVVKDFLLQVDGVHRISIAQYNLGTAYTDDLQDFCQKVLLNMFLNGKISVTVSGKTDVTAGEKLNVIITMDNVVFKAKLNSDE